MTITTVATTTQVYQVFIRATPEQIWEAITTPEFTARYFHGARITVTPERLRSIGTDARCGRTRRCPSMTRHDV